MEKLEMEPRQTGVRSAKLLPGVIPKGRIMRIDHSLFYISVMLQIFK